MTSMSDELPPPLVSPEVDLRDFPYTPLFRARLFGSGFHARADDAEWRAGVTLWLKSWDQNPSGSLPDDDIELARLAELGRDVKTWLRVKAMALRGWVRCSDGRLYHRVVAEGINEAWQSKVDQRTRTAKARLEKLRKKLALTTDPTERAHLEAIVAALQNEITESVTKSVAAPVTSPVASPPTENVTNPVTHSVPDSVTSSVTESVTDPATHSVTGSKRREGKGRESSPYSPPRPRTPKPLALPERFEAFYAAYPLHKARGAAEKAWSKALALADPEAIIGGAQRYAAECRRKGTEPKFTAHPATWLNEKRWLDEPEIRAAPAPINGSSHAIGGDDDDQWRHRMGMHQRNAKMWLSTWGSEPGSPHCDVPKHILAEFGFGEDQRGAAE